VSWPEAHRAVTVLALLAWAAAACQPLPRPFQPEDKSRVDLSGFGGVADKVVVFVAGIDDAPPAFDRAVRGALAKRLGEYGVAASERVANRASYMLICALARDRDGEPVLAWRLIDADGLVVGMVDQPVPGGRAAWARADAALVEAVVAAAAPRLAAVVEDADAAALAATRAWVERAVAVGRIEGAPGDGEAALAAALGAALVRRGIAVAAAATADSLVVEGSVRRSRRDDRDLIEIRWAVLAPDGSELGAVSQSNLVPAGVLDGAWGPVAEAVAEGAAGGVHALLSEIAPLAPAQ
jgi:hypothetical protein